MPQPDGESAWSQFKDDLARLLDSMKPGQSLTLATRRRMHFVRVLWSTDRVLRLEAVSNGHLPAAARLDVEALDLLEDLGWHPPTHFVDQGDVAIAGSTHHFVDRYDWSGDELASILVRTLRGVYEVAQPADLADDLADDRGALVPAPAADAAAHAPERGDRPATMADDPILFELIDRLSATALVSSVIEVPDTDRMVRIQARRGGLTVFYDAANRLVRAAVPVVDGFQASTEALLALNDCGRPMRCGRLELRDGAVFALVDLPVVADVADLLMRYLESVDAGLEGLRETLRPFTRHPMGDVRFIPR